MYKYLHETPSLCTSSDQVDIPLGTAAIHLKVGVCPSSKMQYTPNKPQSVFTVVLMWDLRFS